MTDVLENRLIEYAHNLIADHLKAEYEYQIGKWQTAIDQLIDARQAALDNMQRILETGANQAIAARQQQQMNALSLASFAFLAGPALSWLSGMVQYNLYPRWRPTPGTLTRLEFLNRGINVPKDYNKVHAKVFGDMTKGVVGFGIDLLIKPDAPPPGPDIQNALRRVAASTDGLSFGTNLRDALRSQAEVTTKAIMSLAVKINQDSNWNPNWGAECLKRLDRLNPQAKRAGDRERKRLAEAMIVDDINRQREKWADEWFYYGREPQGFVLPRVSDAMELEMWALWILQEEFSVKSVDSSRGDVHSEDNHLIGRDGYDLNFATAVTDRLVEFDVLYAGSDAQMNRIVEDNIDHPTGAPKPLLDLGVLDSIWDIQALQRWALSHRPMPTNGGLNSYRRSIGSILNVHN